MSFELFSRTIVELSATERYLLVEGPTCKPVWPWHGLPLRPTWRWMLQEASWGQGRQEAFWGSSVWFFDLTAGKIY